MTFKAQAMFKAVFESITDPMFVIDRKMKVKLVNNGVLQYYGCSSNDTVEDVACYKAFRGRKTPCEGCRASEAINKLEHICYERKGIVDPEKQEQVTCCPAKDPDTGEVYVSVSIIDITDFRQYETELAHADRMIKLGVLLSGMAHEINNPTNTILLNARLLFKSWESFLPILDAYYEANGEFSVGGLSYEEMRKEIPGLLKGIDKSADRIKQIVHDLRTFYSYSDGFARETVQINTLIEEAVRLTSRLIQDKTDNFSCVLAPDMPEVQVNRQGVVQVLINLIVNACQALDDKSQRITLLSKLTDDRSRIIIEVNDEGRGVPVHLVSRIMEPFFSTRRNQGGTGLGLSTSLTIVRSHGGTIQVHSMENKGASIRVALPVKIKVKQFRVLIADDDPATRKVINRIVGRQGKYHLRDVTSGAEALVSLGQDPPDLLLLDIHMPDIDGSEVCRVIKQTPALSEVKVIAMTGLINSPKAKAILAMGYETILEKPVNGNVLIKTMQRVLEDLDG